MTASLRRHRRILSFSIDPSDLAAVLFTDGTATANTANDVYDIVTASGSEAGTAAATSGGWLAELLSLF